MEQELIFSREICIFILKLLVHQMNNLLQKDSYTAHITFHFKASLNILLLAWFTPANLKNRFTGKQPCHCPWYWTYLKQGDGKEAAAAPAGSS